MAHSIAPSLLAADFGKLNEAISEVNKSSASLLHLDVMDGQFVPNISFGVPVIETVAKVSTKPLDIHLMIVDPDRYLSTYAAFKPEYLTIHLEASTHLHRSIHQIKELGCKAGVAINPHTNIELLRDTIKEIDLVCVMSVNPGFGGQSFIENTYDKVIALKELIDETNSYTLIEIDGGVTKDNAEKLSRCGADILVAGSSVFRTPSIIEAITGLHG
ncbi:MAG: Ribulose-phosphate 3-epimerase [Flavobacteriaceae bacterium]|jgi:ribulose-phosphate 3-epimerase|nr:ribulose-phosphate 3-epimerase [Flavobacteriaceae bacterium]CAI8201849.1 MAG: Ribulose-phosphate 3-epimerase [Flavobacteriaceae bacterium]